MSRNIREMRDAGYPQDQAVAAAMRMRAKSRADGGGVRSSLTPQEREIVKYHEDSMRTGRVGRDEQGRPITVYAIGPRIPDGPYAGQFVSVPGWVNGRRLSEDEALRYWRSEIDAGKWPLYKSGDELNRRSEEIHQIMDDDYSPDIGRRSGGGIVARRAEGGGIDSIATRAGINTLKDWIKSGSFNPASGLASAGAGWAGNQLGTWGRGNAGSNIGGTLGGAAGGYFLGPPGAFLGSAIGSALGGNFGPDPSTGPNAQAWIGRGPDGKLTVLGSSGDNGLGADVMPAALARALEIANRYELAGDLPSHFQVRVGGGSWGGQNRGLEPTIELGGHMAPMLSDESLARALARRGYITGADDLGTDPTRVFNGLNWLEPEAVPTRWRSGIHELPDTGFLSFDPGYASVQSDPVTGREWNATPLGGRESALISDTYGATYEPPAASTGLVPEEMPGGMRRGGHVARRADGGRTGTAVGFLSGGSPGRADTVRTRTPAESYVLPADFLAALGDGNGIAGARILDEMFSTGPYGTRLPIRSRSGLPADGGAEQLADGGAAERVDVDLSDGEYVVDPRVVARIGNGSTKHGHRLLDKWVVDTRAKYAKKLKGLPGPVGAEE